MPNFLELSNFFCHRAVVLGGQFSGHTGYDADNSVQDLLHGLLAHPQVLATLEGNYPSTRYSRETLTALAGGCR